MRRFTYHIANRQLYGVEFKSPTPTGEATFFFVPDEETLFKWFAQTNGLRGWHQLPIDRLPDGKRAKLLAFWSGRALV